MFAINYKYIECYGVYCMILYGIVWYCIVFYGILWYFMVLYGIVWNWMRLNGIVWYVIVLYDIAWYGIVLYSIVLHCTVMYCTVMYCTVLYCTVFHCLVPSPWYYVYHLLPEFCRFLSGRYSIRVHYVPTQYTGPLFKGQLVRWCLKTV